LGARSLMVYEVKRFMIIKPDLVDFNIDLSDFEKRDSKSIFEECGIEPKSSTPISEQEPSPMPDRIELDNIVFDALGLTQDERKEVYRAVCQLVWNRISKAKSK